MVLVGSGVWQEDTEGGGTSCTRMRVSSEPRSEAGVTARVVTSWGRVFSANPAEPRSPAVLSWRPL